MSSRTSLSSSCHEIEAKKPHVAILMCTYNGAPYLLEQLESFRSQSYKNWSLWVSDDGSSDETKIIVKAFAKSLSLNSCTIKNGPKKGFFHNFLSITQCNNIDADFYAWSDQDDIWKKDKIQKALNWLEQIAPEKPALYCTRTELINEAGITIGLSPIFKKKPSFKNALVQSIAGGNTMVFNDSARKLFNKIDKEITAPSHDWLMYQIISGAGGIVHYDSAPSILYRQHPNNIIGSNSSILSRLKRINMIIQGRFQHWNNQNIQILEQCNLLQSCNAEILLAYKQAREKSIVKRTIAIAKLGLYRQTFFGNIALILATLLRRL